MSRLSIGPGSLPIHSALLYRLYRTKGPSIYDVHMEDGGGEAQVDACGREEGGPAPCGRPHRNLKLESTDVILSSSHAKKLASFLSEFRLWTEKVEIFLRYKLVI